MLLNSIVKVLGLEQEKDWVSVRRDTTDEQISRINLLYEALWPRETDLLRLLPKPDGNARAIYTGFIHPETVTDFALGASLYFGELIIQHPFLHAGTVKKEYSPVENPRAYRQEFLKAVLFFLTIMPLVEAGLVNLIPDPCNFELPRDALRSQLLKASPELDEVKLEEALRGIEQLKEHDPLAVLQEASLASGEKNGEVSLMKLAPNFEMAMYLAQATGSCIVTDHSFRWQEIRSAINRRVSWSESVLSTLAHNIEGSSLAFPQNVADIKALAADKAFATYPALMHDVFKYLLKLGDREPKPNLEGHLNARFAKAHGPAQAAIKKARIPAKQGRLSCVFPLGGIQDNTVNRLLLMSSSEWHLPSVPMAFLLAGQASRKAEQQGV